jgi:hypothetical protein
MRRFSDEEGTKVLGKGLCGMAGICLGFVVESGWWLPPVLGKVTTTLGCWPSGVSATLVEEARARAAI